MYADLRPFVQLVRRAGLALALLVVGIGAPLSEELLFRGFLLSALARTRLGFWGAAADHDGACGQPCTPAIRWSASSRCS